MHQDTGCGQSKKKTPCPSKLIYFCFWLLLYNKIRRVCIIKSLCTIYFVCVCVSTVDILRINFCVATSRSKWLISTPYEVPIQRTQIFIACREIITTFYACFFFFADVAFVLYNTFGIAVCPFRMTTAAAAVLRQSNSKANKCAKIKCMIQKLCKSPCSHKKSTGKNSKKEQKKQTVHSIPFESVLLL